MASLHFIPWITIELVFRVREANRFAPTQTLIFPRFLLAIWQFNDLETSFGDLNAVWKLLVVSKSNQFASKTPSSYCLLCSFPFFFSLLLFIHSYAERQRIHFSGEYARLISKRDSVRATTKMKEIEFNPHIVPRGRREIASRWGACVCERWAKWRSCLSLILNACRNYERDSV